MVSVGIHLPLIVLEDLVFGDKRQKIATIFFPILTLMWIRVLGSSLDTISGVNVLLYDIFPSNCD